MNKQSATRPLLHFVKRTVPHVVSTLSSISIRVYACMLYVHLCVCPCMCMCIHQAANRQAADPLWVVFHFSFTPHEQPQGSFILSFLFSSSSPPPSIYLVIIVTWIVSDREEHSFENKTPALKARERKRNFILVPAARASDEFSSPCVSLFTVWVSLVRKNIIVWGGQSTEDAVCWEKTVTQFFFFKWRLVTQRQW